MNDDIEKGLLGIVVDETTISQVMPDINSLTYRGYAVQDLCEKCSFEEVAYLILNKELPNKSQLNKFKKQLEKNRNINQLKIILANEATAMLHGKTAAQRAEQTAKNTFEKKSIGEDLPSVKIKKEELINGINIIDLVIASNLLSSKSEVRRMIKNKGIKINNEPIENEKYKVTLSNFNQKNFLKLSHGKKNHVIFKII